MELGQVENWQSQWYKVAAMEGGAVWTSLVRRRWQKHQRTLEDKMTWQQKHLPAAMEAKKAAAEQRFAGNGKYSCPHCFEPKVTMFLRSLKKHVDVCSKLSEDIRRRQAEQRSKPTKRLRITEKQPAVEAPSGSASSRVVLRPAPAKQTRQQLQLLRAKDAFRNLEGLMTGIRRWFGQLTNVGSRFARCL